MIEGRGLKFFFINSFCINRFSHYWYRYPVQQNNPCQDVSIYIFYITMINPQIQTFAILNQEANCVVTYLNIKNLHIILRLTAHAVDSESWGGYSLCEGDGQAPRYRPPFFKALGKNIDFRPPFFKVPGKNIDFRPPFSDF